MISRSLNAKFDRETSIYLNNELSMKGFCIVDDVLPTWLLRSLSNEIMLMETILEQSPNRLSVNESFPPAESDFIILSKPNVFERSIVERAKMMVHNPTLLSMIPYLVSLWDDKNELLGTYNAFKHSCDVLNDSITDLDQIKVALIKYGGCFPCHTDTTFETSRQLSVTIYLDEEYSKESTERNSCSCDGGELRIYPFPDGDVTDIKPVFGRMVLFSACNTFHRVLPSQQEKRTCLSFMFYGNDQCLADGISDSSHTHPYSTAYPYALPDWSPEVYQWRTVVTPLVFFDEFLSSIWGAFMDPNRVCTDTDTDTGAFRGFFAPALDVSLGELPSEVPIPVTTIALTNVVNVVRESELMNTRRLAALLTARPRPVDGGGGGDENGDMDIGNLQQAEWGRLEQAVLERIRRTQQVKRVMEHFVRRCRRLVQTEGAVRSAFYRYVTQSQHVISPMLLSTLPLFGSSHG